LWGEGEPTQIEGKEETGDKMKKGFIIFAVIAVVAVLAFAFLTQDDFRQGLLGKSDETAQVNQEAIKAATSLLREQQVAEYELLVDAFMELYPLTDVQDVWYLIVVTLEVDYRYRAKIDELDKGK